MNSSAAEIERAGGAVHKAPWDIPDVGRLACVADPQGSIIYIVKGAVDTTSTSFAATEPMVGHCAWNELNTTDPAAAIAVYTGQFGWRQEGEMDIGPMGKYEFFHHGDAMIGGVMQKVPEMPVSAWMYYFRVPDIDVAVATVNRMGGRIMQDPTAIPGGDFALAGWDPQAAAFTLVGARQ